MDKWKCGPACSKGFEDQDTRLHPARGGGDRQALSLPRVRGIRGCPFVAHGEPVDFDSLTWPPGPLRTVPHMNAHDLAAEIKRFNGGTSPQNALVWERTAWCAARDDVHYYYRPLWKDAKSTRRLDKRYSTRVLDGPALGRICPAGRDEDAVLCEMFQLDGAWPTYSAGRALNSGRSTWKSFDKARLRMWVLMKLRGFCRSCCRLSRLLPGSRLA